MSESTPSTLPVVDGVDTTCDRSVGPTHPKLSLWQTAQQPLWQNSNMNRTSQWNFERDEILEAQLGKKMETSRAWHLRGKSQTKQNKERK